MATRPYLKKPKPVKRARRRPYIPKKDRKPEPKRRPRSAQSSFSRHEVIIAQVILIAIFLLLLGMMIGVAISAPRYQSKVVATGIYDRTNRVTLTWVDQAWHSTRQACMVRASQIAKEVSDKVWYWRGLKLDHAPLPSCSELS